jgi:hypothetical protein
MTDREGLEKAQYIIDICIGDMDRERVEACQNSFLYGLLKVSAAYSR